MSQQNEQIILLTRADDLGYTHTGNVAILQSMREGIIRCASLLAISPWFEEGVRMARENPHLCFGAHLGIVGEWQGYRWRPVLPYSEVRSLVDEDGFLWQSPIEFWAHNPDMGELEAEFNAQIELALKKGMHLGYIDTHYVLPSHEKYQPIVQRLGNKFGLPVSGLLGEHMLDDFGIYTVPPPEKEEALDKALRRLEPGLHLLVAHPGLTSIENDALVHSEPTHIQYMGTGRLRAAETLAYTSPRIQNLVKELGIKLTSYTELCKN
jgi:chitin disaccharide deacetylase